jgi:hypothetical protein
MILFPFLFGVLFTFCWFPASPQILRSNQTICGTSFPVVITEVSLFSGYDSSRDEWSVLVFHPRKFNSLNTVAVLLSIFCVSVFLIQFITYSFKLQTVLNSSRVDDWGVFYASPDNQVRHLFCFNQNNSCNVF